jgi:hypothetical protein
LIHNGKDTIYLAKNTSEETKRLFFGNKIWIKKEIPTKNSRDFS